MAAMSLADRLFTSHDIDILDSGASADTSTSRQMSLMKVLLLSGKGNGQKASSDSI